MGETLVDVRVVTPPRDARARLAAAQAIGELGPPAPTFLEAKARLAAPGVLASGLPATLAARLQRLVQEQGGLLSVQPRTAPTPPRAGPGQWLWLAGALAAAGLTGWAVLRTPPPPAPPQAQSPAPNPDAIPSPARPAPPPAPEPDDGDLAERARQASVTVRCPSATGYGFLLRGRAVVPEQALCAPEQPLRLQLADGRRLPARLERALPRLGLAVLQVEGDVPDGLSEGDSTGLSGDTPLQHLPEPILAQLADVRLIAAEVPDCGVPLLSLADAGPRPGTALLHRGRVVGVAIELPGTLATGPVAAPIEALVAPLGTHAAGWSRRLATTRKPEARLRAAFLQGLSQPYLAGVARAADGVRAALVLPQPAPEGNAVRLRWLGAGRLRCEVRAAFDGFRPLAEASTALREVPRVAWLMDEPGASALLSGEGVLTPLDCTAEDLEAAGVLELPAGDGHSGRAAVGAGELAASSRATRQQEASALARQEAVEEQRAQQEKERHWRQRFRQLHQRLREAEHRAEWLRKDLARRQSWSGSMDEAPTSLGDLEQLKAALAEAETGLEKLRAEEHELERVASLASVPREWRR